MPPLFLVAPTVSEQSAMSAMTIFAPCAANRLQKACPMPLAPPVTTARFPVDILAFSPFFCVELLRSKHFGFWQLQVDYPKTELFPKYFRRRAYAVKVPAG